MDLEKKYLEQRQWFIDRIGKTVYRCDLECNCSVCQSGKKGILITDYDQACYLNDCKGEMGINYYNSLEELEADIDNRAENYVKKTKISKKTYKGDVVTAYVIGASDQEEIINRKLKKLKEDFGVLFDQNELLIKQNKKISSEFAGYRINNPSYSPNDTCESCGTAVRNCIC